MRIAYLRYLRNCLLKDTLTALFFEFTPLAEDGIHDLIDSIDLIDCFAFNCYCIQQAKAVQHELFDGDTQEHAIPRNVRGPSTTSTAAWRKKMIETKAQIENAYGDDFYDLLPRKLLADFITRFAAALTCRMHGVFADLFDCLAQSAKLMVVECADARREYARFKELGIV